MGKMKHGPHLLQPKFVYLYRIAFGMLRPILQSFTDSFLNLLQQYSAL